MEFQKFNKIPRLSRDIVITEKIDGTNGQIAIFKKQKIFSYFCNDSLSSSFNSPVLYADRMTDEFINNHCLYKKDDLYLFAGSRNRWLYPTSDNYGFAKWVQANAEELLKLGEGRHYGEWFGKGIQRGYGLDEKRFALFNVNKWYDAKRKELGIESAKAQPCPDCCTVVPILYKGIFDTDKVQYNLDLLKQYGSVAVPKFMNPEGLIVFHTASGQMFKKTIENDEKPKGQKE